MNAYTTHHPRWYRKRVSTYWWFGQWPYLKFILREISSVFVAIFVGFTLLEIGALVAGPDAYEELQRWLQVPVVIALNMVSFLFVLFHSVTWFNLTPRAMVFRVGGRRVSDLWIALPNYVAWVVVSGVVFHFVLAGG